MEVITMLADEIHKIQQEALEKKQVDAELNYQLNKEKLIEYIKEYVNTNPDKEFVEIHQRNNILYCGYEEYDRSLPIEELCRRLIKDNYNRLVGEFKEDGVILETIEAYKLAITDKFLKTKPLEVKVDEYYKISWKQIYQIDRGD